MSSIGNVETGAREAGEKFLQKICKTLQISRQELLRDPRESLREDDQPDYEKPGLLVREVDEAPIYGAKENQRSLKNTPAVERIRLATKLRGDARELRNIAMRMEEEAETLERDSGLDIS